MQLQVGAEDNGVLSLSLIGRLDTPGVDSIETPLTAHLVPRGARAMIDLSQVTFIGSGGIRMFITIARALGRKGGKLVLYGAQPPSPSRTACPLSSPRPIAKAKPSASRCGSSGLRSCRCARTPRPPRQWCATEHSSL